jgi:glycosyltransferase involved in cell wall biosynthesis
VRHTVAEKTSPRFAVDIIKGLFAPTPVAVFRHQSHKMRATVDHLRSDISFDAVVCDFLSSAPHFSDLSGVVLFQHNVEAVIWQRHAGNAATPLHRYYFGMQARRMVEYERTVCKRVKSVIAVSDQDAQTMRDLYGVTRVGVVPTGVDVEFFTPSQESPPTTDLAFIGSMDWMPNVDGVLWFADEVLPRIRQKLPQSSVAVVGRKPAPEITRLAERDPLIRITGTVEDVRPWLWGSKIAVVPLRIGGGTRLKIYEAMAARTPVVSTTIGAEGLGVSHGENILIADSPEALAESCIHLLRDADERRRLSAAAFEHVRTRHSWDTAADAFERLLGAP